MVRNLAIGNLTPISAVDAKDPREHRQSPEQSSPYRCPPKEQVENPQQRDQSGTTSRK